MSTPAAPLGYLTPRLKPRVPHRTARGSRAGLLRGLGVPAAAALLGVAIASGRLQLIVLALVPFAAAVLSRPDAAVPVFAAGFYLNLPVVMAGAAGVPTSLASAFALVLALPIVVHVVLRRETLVLTPALGLMLGYLVALVLSATFAGGPGSDSASGVSSFLLEGLLLFLLVTNAVRTPQVLRAVVWALLLAGAVMGLVSIWAELSHTYHSALGGFARVSADDVPGIGPKPRPRLAGPIGETNRYAQVMLMLVPLGIACIRLAGSRGLRLAAMGATGLVLSGMLLTYSRGAAVALAIVALAMVGSGFIRVRHLFLLVAVLGAIVVVAAPTYLERLASLSDVQSATSQDSAQADGALRGRATENLAALNTFRDHPLVGVGPGQFFARYSQTYANELDLRYLKTSRRAHNLYLEIAADTGVLGLAAFLAVVLVTIGQLVRAARLCAVRRPDLALLAHGFALSLFAYLTTGLFLQLAYQRYFWFLLALANATIWIAARAVATRPAAA
jgi:putative inorganic carbon (hco3(-)) transporter